MRYCKFCEKKNRTSNPCFCSRNCKNLYRKKLYNDKLKLQAKIKNINRELKEIKTHKLFLDENEINKRYKMGESINSIATSFNVDWETIKRRI